MSIFPNSAKSLIIKEGSVPSKNLLRSILGETFFIIKFNGELKILLCLFKTKLPKIKLEILVEDESLGTVTDVITKTANTGKIGDGKIFVSNIEDVIRIRTGETGSDAI